MKNFMSFVLISWIGMTSSPVSSSEPNLRDCVESIHLNEITNNSVVYVPQETVCFYCGIIGFGYYNFSINGTAIPNSTVPAKVVVVVMNSSSIHMEVLVVSNARVLNNYFTTTIQCHNSLHKTIYQAEIQLKDLKPPLIKKGSTTITDSITIIEGSTLDLRCDGSNSIPQPSLKWISPDETVVSETGHLEIENITEDEAGEYTCIATIPNTNMTINSTLIVQLLNLTTTAVDNGEEWYENELYWVAGGVGILTCCCCIINCIAIPCLCLHKRNKKKRRHSLLRDNSTFSEPVAATQQHPLTVQNSQYNTVVPNTPDSTTTPFNGQYYMIETQPEQVESPVIPAIPLSQYSMIQTIPESNIPDQKEQVTVTNGQYSAVLKSVKEPSATAPDQNTPGEVQYAEPQFTSRPVEQPDIVDFTIPTETQDQQYSTVREATSDPSNPSRVKNSKGLVYVEVGLEKSLGRQRPPDTITERVEYASLDLKTMAERPSPPAEEPKTHHLDANISLDQILIQLKEVEPNWRSFGEAVGTQNLEDIWDYVETESGAMVEVVDGWMAKLHPQKPTWREIANLVGSIGHHHLADSLRQAYTSGVLPIAVSNNVPDSILPNTEPPPDIPAREPNRNENISDEAPPPIPLRTYSKSS